jgi:geranylgeranyl pyrophosphate synthase
MTERAGEDRGFRAEAQVHFALADGRAFSLSAALVRLPAMDGGAPAHLLRSSLTDVGGRRCATLSIGDRRVPEVLRERFGREPGSRHPLAIRALQDVLAAGRLPYPDAISHQAAVATDGMSCELAGNRMLALPSGGHQLRLEYPDEHIVCELTLRPMSSPIERGGERGGQAPLSSWVPRFEVEGTVALRGVPHAIAQATGTYFQASGPDCDRVIVHLDDATDIHAWRGTADDPRAGGRAIVVGAIVVGAEREVADHDDVTLEPLASWTSLYTFHDYAVAWRLRIPAAQIDLELRAAVADQELVTVTASDPLWRGRCDVTGTVAGRPVTGVAYLEQVARDAAATLPELIAAVPRETLRVIHQQLPLPLASEHVLAMVSGDRGRYVRDVDLEEFQRILIQPIREILDRKAKAWRSYTGVVCYYALRGDKRRQDIIDVLLGLAEVIHVGSLIVDDVEDASATRRGGPSCHVAHGVPIAINAGTFCYFVWQAWFARVDVPSAARLQIYEIYFEFMRVAHLGQALDIQGFTRGMAEEIVATGDVTLLARQMKNVYLLKTGAPASVFARIGAILAGGGVAQVGAVGDLFEALGIAFQIMDDVQNLKGFQGDVKHCEDLAQAKVTMPVLEAMRVLDLPARRDLWARIQRCGQEPELVPGIVDTLERCGAFTACRDQAHVLLEDAWQRAAPLLEDSVAKIMLRSFCSYVVECLG